MANGEVKIDGRGPTFAIRIEPIVVKDKIGGAKSKRTPKGGAADGKAHDANKPYSIKLVGSEGAGSAPKVKGDALDMTQGRTFKSSTVRQREKRENEKQQKLKDKMK